MQPSVDGTEWRVVDEQEAEENEFAVEVTGATDWYCDSWML